MSEKKYSAPMRFAHRGLVQYAPENTIAAFEAAIDHGFEGIEIDIGVSSDGEPIVAHDASFKRMTGGAVKTKLCDMRWEDIVSVELPYEKHLLPVKLPPLTQLEFLAAFPSIVPGERFGADGRVLRGKDTRVTHLSRFADFDKWFASRTEDVIIEIEIKARGIMPRLHEILAVSPNNSRYIVFSGNSDINAEIQAEFAHTGKPAGLRLGANIRFLTDEKKVFVEKSDLFEVGLNAGHITDDSIKWLKARNVRILSNLGDYPKWWEQLVKLDVMGFKTNYAEAFTAWLEKN